MIGLQVWSELRARSEQLRETRGFLANLASSLSSEADDTIAIAKSNLLGVVERLEVDGTAPASLARLRSLLVTTVGEHAGVRDITIIGEDGRWLASSRPATGDNNADLEYFRHHRDDPSRAAFIGPPIKSRVTGRWILTVSRRFQSADGSFAGVVVAIIDASFFVDRYAAIELGPGGLIILGTTQGVVLASHPWNEQTMGRAFPNARLFSELSEHLAGSYEAIGAVDGIARLAGYRGSDRYPLVVVATMSKDQALAGWRHDASIHMLAAAAMAGGVAMLGLFLIRQARHTRASQERLSESEERSRLLLHSNVTEALYLLDPDGIIETWNTGAERIMGYADAEVIGVNFAMFFPPEASSEPARVLAIARARGHYAGDGWRIRKDGSRFEAHVAIDAVRRADGTLRGFVKVTMDITKQRAEKAQREELSRVLVQARDHAEQANRAKSRFLSGITHELRTPLHGILGYVELLGLEGSLKPAQLERVEAIRAAGQYLLGTINAVLDMSQIEAEQMDLRPVSVELLDLVQDCVDVVSPVAKAKGLALVLAPAPPLRVLADPTRLRQVLINLLGNAVKFTPAGSVEVRQTKLTGCVRLEVADTGPGIEGSHRDKLFKSFERLSAEANSGIEGSGLGLALSARTRAVDGWNDRLRGQSWRRQRVLAGTAAERRR